MSRLFQGLFIEFVSNPSNGQDPFGVAVILLHCFSETTDVNVNRSWSNEGLSSPHAIEKLIPVKHAVGILDQKTEQLELFQSQFNRFAANENFVGGEVNF